MLETDNIKLQPIADSGDWDTFVAMASSEEAHLCGVQEDAKILQQGCQPNSSRQGTFGIYSDHRLIGYSQYVVNAQNVASFSLYIAPQFRRSGWGRAAVGLLNSVMFRELNVIAIRHTAFLSNTTMVKILEGTGAVQVGILRQGGRRIDLKNQRTLIKPCVILEYNSIDFNRAQKKLKPSPASSYGIDVESFLAKELKRLELQAAISIGPDSVIDNVIQSNPGATIMDVGAGLGTLSAKLASRFPQHKFIALEENPEFVAAAKHKFPASANPNLSIIQADIFDSDRLIAATDIFTLRLVAQHLGPSGLQGLFNKIKAARQNKPFSIIVCDVDDRLWLFEPNFPGLKLALDAANASQKKFGGDRWIGGKIFGIANSCGLTIRGVYSSSFDSNTLGRDNFDAIIAPLLAEKIDPDYLDENALQDVLASIQEWTTLKDRFGMGTLLTYIITNGE